MPAILHPIASGPEGKLVFAILPPMCLFAVGLVEIRSADQRLTLTALGQRIYDQFRGKLGGK